MCSMGGKRSAEPSCEAWHLFNPDLISQFQFGDRIEFDRGSYFHWGLYLQDGYILHLNPQEAPGNAETCDDHKWFNGIVTMEYLSFVADDDKIRVVRDKIGKSRSSTDINLLVRINLNEPTLFSYCSSIFGSENFVNFIKFGNPFSSQMLTSRFWPNALGPCTFYAISQGIVDPVAILPRGTLNFKLKTFPVAGDKLMRTLELREICINVGKEVRNMSKAKINKLVVY